MLMKHAHTGTAGGRDHHQRSSRAGRQTCYMDQQCRRKRYLAEGRIDQRVRQEWIRICRATTLVYGGHWRA